MNLKKDHNHGGEVPNRQIVIAQLDDASKAQNESNNAFNLSETDREKSISELGQNDWVSEVLELWKQNEGHPERQAEVVRSYLNQVFQSRQLSLVAMAKMLLERYPFLTDYFDYWLVTLLIEKNQITQAQRFAKNLINSKNPFIRQKGQLWFEQWVQNQRIERLRIGIVGATNVIQEIEKVFRLVFAQDQSESGLEIVTFSEPQNFEDWGELFNQVHKQRIAVLLGSLKMRSVDWVAHYLNQYQVVFIDLGQKSGLFKKSPFFIQAGLSLETQIMALLKIARESLGLKKMVLLFANDGYGVEVANVVWDVWEFLKGDLDVVMGYDPKESDFQELAAILAKKDPPHLIRRQSEAKEIRQELIRKGAKSLKELKSLKDEFLLPAQFDFDAIFIADGPRNGIKVLSALAYYGIKKVSVFVPNSWYGDYLSQKNVGTSWEGRIHMVVTYHDLMRFSDASGRSIYSEFFARYQHEPTFIHYLTFDVAQWLRYVLIHKAVQTRLELQEALKETRYVVSLGRSHYELFVDDYNELFWPLKWLRYEKDRHFLLIR